MIKDFFNFISPLSPLITSNYIFVITLLLIVLFFVIVGPLIVILSISIKSKLNRKPTNSTKENKSNTTKEFYDKLSPSVRIYNLAENISDLSSRHLIDIQKIESRPRGDGKLFVNKLSLNLNYKMATTSKEKEAAGVITYLLLSIYKLSSLVFNSKINCDNINPLLDRSTTLSSLLIDPKYKVDIYQEAEIISEIKEITDAINEFTLTEDKLIVDKELSLNATALEDFKQSL